MTIKTCPKCHGSWVSLRIKYNDKPADPETDATCLDCGWQGKYKDLEVQSSTDEPNSAKRENP